MAKKEVKMPQLGESVTEGTISSWLVKRGDVIKKYDPLAEVITDKVNAEIPSTFSGTIEEILVDVDEPVSVGVTICTIDTVEEESVEQPSPELKQETNPTVSDTNEDKTQKLRYSPAVLRLAQDHNIDLAQVEGSGKGGRITRKDLTKLIEGGKKPTTTPLQQVKEKREKAAVVEMSTGDLEIPVSGVRKAIADNLTKSKLETPHAWMMVEVDVTNLVQYRNQLKKSFQEQEGYSLTYLPFFIKATVEALKEFPQMNSMWAGDKIVQKKEINISLAVATDDALYVPVIKHADEKSIKGIARDIQELAQKVRTGTITSDDMQGGTFTVNNTGTFGSVLSTPIINGSQAAILSIESIVKRPVVIESEAGDMIAIRSMVNLCLSLDHRVLDGLICGRFLARLKEKLEQISNDTTSLY